jgi:hypothetical protein
MRLLAVLAVVALVLFPTIAIAQAPVQPCRFYGTVQVNGLNVPDGTEIQALIDGNVVGNTTTPAVYGASSYALLIAQPEGADYAGKAVTFTIAGDAAAQTGNWTLGGNIKLDLTIGQGGGGGGTGGGGITDVKVTTLPPGGNATSNYNKVTGVLTLGIPAGATGATGQTGATGATGPAGKSASNVMGIVAIVIAVIALIVAVVAVLRRPHTVNVT